MIKKLHFKTMLLLCAMIMGIGSAWAEEVTFNYEDYKGQGTTSSGSEYTMVKTDVSIGDTKFFGNNSQAHFYAGGTTTITPASGVTITKIVLTATSASYNGFQSDGKVTPSTGTVSFNGTAVTWEGSASSAFTISHDKQIRWTSIVVTYSKSSSDPVDPSVTISGTTVAEGGTLTITYPSNLTTISFESNNTSVATVSNAGVVTGVAAGTATITASWAAVANTYNAGTATFNVTVVQATIYEQVTNANQLVAGNEYILVATENSMAMGAQNGSIRKNVSVTIANNKVAITDEEVAVLTLGGVDEAWTFLASDNSLYLALNSASNAIHTSDDPTANAAKWIIKEDFELESASIPGRVLKYNSGSPRFACYASGQKIAVLFVKSGSASAPQTPSISADNINIAYDATEGSIAYTLKNGVEGGVLTATTTANWLTIGTVGETIPFTCDANAETTERTATVTLTYTYGNENVTKDVTVTQAAAPAPAVVYTTIPALFAAATSTETEVQVTFDSWVVSGVSTNGRNVFVTDNDGHGFVIYYTSNMSSTFSAGDILSGNAVACSLKLYNGFAELLNLNASDLTITAGGTVSEADIPLADLEGVNTGVLVSYENLTCSVDNSKYYLSDGTTTLQVYNSLFAFEALEDGKTYNITGIYQQYNSTKEILPRSADDIEEVSAPVVEYTLTVTASDNVEIFTFVGGTANEGVEGATTLQVSSGTEVGLSVSATQGYVLKLLVDGTDVTSQLDDTGYYSFNMPTHNVTVSATAVAPEEIIGSFVKVTSTDEITSGQYLIVYEEGSVAFDGSRDDSDNNKLDAVSNTIGVTIENGVIAATTTNVTSVFNIDVTAGTLQSASGLYIGVSSNSNGLKTSEDATKYTNSFSIDEGGNAVIAAVFDESAMSLRYNKASNQERFRYYKDSGQQAIQLYKFVADADDVEVTVTSAGYATYCSEKALDFSDTGLTAYKAILDGSEVSFTEVKQVPAGEGVLLKGDAGTYNVPVAASAAALTDNAFIGVIEATTISEPGIFVLMNEDYGVGFYRTKNAFTVGAHTAYLPALAGGSRSFIGLNETTGISDVNRETITNNRYFDLQGRRVAQPTKGLYIVNGKKVVVK